MKKLISPSPTIWLVVAVFAIVSAVYLLAQPATTNRDGKLNDAIALLNAGKPEQAKELIAAISKDNPDYAVAQCYNALCLYESKNTLGFLKALESPLVQNADVTPEIRESLDCKEIEVLFITESLKTCSPRLNRSKRNTRIQNSPTLWRNIIWLRCSSAG